MSSALPLGDPAETVGPEVLPPSPQELEEILRGRPTLTRWIGWRLRLLLVCVLTGCAGVFLLTKYLADQPRLQSSWKVTPEGEVKLAGTDNPTLRPYLGATLVSVKGPRGRVLPIDPAALRQSQRWISNDGQRELQRIMRASITTAAQAWPEGPVAFRFSFADGRTAQVVAQPAGYGGLPLLYWLLTAVALLLFLVGMVVPLAAPHRLNLLYALMASCQSGNLLLMAVELAQGLNAPPFMVGLDWRARIGFDLVTAAAMVAIAASFPRGLPGARAWMAAGGAIAIVTFTLSTSPGIPYAWWLVQGGTLILGVMAFGLMSWSSRHMAHPFTLVLRRFTAITLGTWALLTASVAASEARPELLHGVTTIGSMIWYVFFASLLLLVPYLSRSQQVLREFSLLAATSTVATSLDLLFVAVFSLSQFTSITLALTLSLGAYLATRQWLLGHLLGGSRLTMERLFDRLYRMAREIQIDPGRAESTLTRLMRELFEPLEVVPLHQSVTLTTVLGNGSALIVPVARLMPPASGRPAPRSLLIRHAHHGRRLFTQEDGRLVEQVMEQLHRAVSFDHAVEQGRCEERLRIAQDLHDDIGARLLTLMYQAPTPEIEDYIRHTLQDLKTLTRGLATQHHTLGHAAAEWKADLSQRLELAHLRLRWQATFDRDVDLSMVQWSALTRILRELVNNIIAHARATDVQVDLRLQEDRLTLTVSDNGQGADPQAWAHGLGLGGVRKRVKQLGGTVAWEATPPRGIACRVVVPRLSSSG